MITEIICDNCHKPIPSRRVDRKGLLKELDGAIKMTKFYRDIYDQCEQKIRDGNSRYEKVDGLSTIGLGSYFDQKNRESISSDRILLGINNVGIFFTSKERENKND